MPKKRPITYLTEPPIKKLVDAPGPEADVTALREHYRRVQAIFATHHYEDVLFSCHWCCDSESGLAYTKPDERRGDRVFCSARCANAYAAYQAKALRKGQKPQSTFRDEPKALEDEKPTEPESPPKPTPAPKAAIAERRPAPDRPKQRKGRKRGRKPARADGKCPKGLHEMTPDNQYHYSGGVWCRACRKASRDRSAAKKREKGGK